MEEKLLDCPFCGKEPIVEHIEPHSHPISGMPDFGGSYYAECPLCDFRRFGDTKELAIKTWNHRVPITKMLDEYLNPIAEQLGLNLSEYRSYDILMDGIVNKYTQS